MGLLMRFLMGLLDLMGLLMGVIDLMRLLMGSVDLGPSYKSIFFTR